MGDIAHAKRYKENNMERNIGVKCDVVECAHNEDGTNCMLQKIMVTCPGGERCTCCGDYEERGRLNPFGE